MDIKRRVLKIWCIESLVFDYVVAEVLIKLLHVCWPTKFI